MTTTPTRTHRSMRPAIGALGLSAALVLPSASAASAATLPKPWDCGPVASMECLSFSGYAGEPDAFLDGWGTPVNNGHNCVNYVAYRLASAGFGGHLQGNASAWDDYARDHDGFVVDGTPAVSAVAHWDTAGRNHVAWVDDVVTDEAGTVTALLVSDSNWSSADGGRRTISPGSDDWPDNFIHVEGVSGTPVATAGAGPAAAPAAELDLGELAQLFDERPDLHATHSIVLRLYWAVLARTPEYGGASFWVDAYDSGEWDLRRIAAHFVVSEEFTDRYGTGLDNAAFTTIVYRNVLGREPEVGGFAFWKGQLDEGMDRSEMVLLISNDTEFVAGHPLPSDG